MLLIFSHPNTDFYGLIWLQAWRIFNAVYLLWLYENLLPRQF